MEKTIPWLKYSSFNLPKLKGGVGLPDVYKYYLACQLVHIVDWHVYAQGKTWVNLERRLTLEFLSILAFPQTLAKGAFSPSTYLICAIEFHFHPILLDQRYSNPDFPQECLGTFPSWRYNQIKHNQRVKLSNGQDLLPPMSLYAQKETPVTFDLGYLFDVKWITVKIPTKHIRLGKGSYMSSFPDETIEFVCKGFVAIQEITSRLELCGWYRTPFPPHKCCPAVSKLCWRCGREEGTMLHI